MKRRRLWHRVHSWLGLKLSIMTSFICVTGTLAVFGKEIDWLLNPEMRALPPSSSSANAEASSAATWGAIYASARSAYPDGTLRFLMMGPDPWWSRLAVFESPSGELLRVWIDPYTAEYRGVTDWFNVQRFLRQTHRHLMLPTAIGIPIVSLFALVLIASSVTGLAAYKRFWRGFFRAPRFGRRPGRVWLGDLHRLGALWSLWFTLIIALTGLWYLAEKSLGGAAPPFPEPEPALARESALPLGFNGDDVDRIVAAARRHAPDFAVRTIAFPQRTSASLQIGGQAGALLVRDRANAVHVDPSTFMVTGEHWGEALSMHQRISEMADPLHFGTWGGFASKCLWFVFGFALSGLSITGACIYGLRVAKSEAPTLHGAGAAA